MAVVVLEHAIEMKEELEAVEKLGQAGDLSIARLWLPSWPYIAV